MKFLADENFPAPAVRVLREAGFDVSYIREDARGAADDVVLATAEAQDRVLLSSDKDFAEPVFRRARADGPGVVLFRLKAISPEEFGALALAALRSRSD